MVNLRPHKIQVKEQSGKPRRDENGYMIETKPSWSIPMPCRYETDGKDNIVENPDGSFTKYEYVVWLDKTDVDLEHKFVRLINEKDEIIEDERQVQKQPPSQLRTKLYL